MPKPEWGEWGGDRVTRPPRPADNLNLVRKLLVARTRGQYKYIYISNCYIYALRKRKQRPVTATIMALRGFSAFEARFRAKMAQSAPTDVLVKRRIKEGLTEERTKCHS